MALHEKEMEQIYTIVEARFPAYGEEMRELLGELLGEPANDISPSELPEAVLETIATRLRLTSDEFGSPGARQPLRDYINQAEEYQREVEELSPKDRLQRYRECQKEAVATRDARWHEEGEAADAVEFFNNPDCDADFAFWLKMPGWTEEQTVALSLGKDPARINMETLDPLVGRSNFRKEYRRRLQLIQALFKAREIDLLEPTAFCGWANSVGFQLPAELRDVVARPEEEASEWKEKYEKAASELERVNNELQKLKKLDQEIKGKTLRSAYLMILGMAVARFGHCTIKSKGKSGPISGELKHLGLAIGDETINDWLTDAAESLDFAIDVPIQRHTAPWPARMPSIRIGVEERFPKSDSQHPK